MAHNLFITPRQITWHRGRKWHSNPIRKNSIPLSIAKGIWLLMAWINEMKTIALNLRIVVIPRRRKLHSKRRSPCFLVIFFCCNPTSWKEKMPRIKNSYLCLSNSEVSVSATIMAVGEKGDGNVYTGVRIMVGLPGACLQRLLKRFNNFCIIY